MNAIFQIYRRDVKRIITNWAALVIIIGLIFLPSMYAWFNIKSAWNPYGNTKGLKVAIVNEDRGATVLNQQINIGNEVVDALKRKPTLGWRFVSKSDATKGVIQGKYYASIIIPADFSLKISTVISDHPQKPELLYSVNEKLNIVAPKYTEKGATGIASEITKNFEKTVSSEVLTVFNQIGIDLQSNIPLLKKTEATIFQLEKDLPEIEKVVKKALNDMNKIQSVIQTVNKDLQLINDLASNAENFTSDLEVFLKNVNQSIQNATPLMKQTLTMLENQSAIVESIITQLQDKRFPPNEAILLTNELQKQLQSSNKSLNSMIQFLQSFNQVNSSVDFEKQINVLKETQVHLEKLINTNEKVNDSLRAGNGRSNSLLQKMETFAKDVNDRLSYLNNHFDTELVPKLNAMNDFAEKSINEMMTVLEDTKKSIPAIKAVLNDTSNLLTMKKGQVEQFVNDFPMIEAKIKELANKLRKAKQKGSIEELINFLRTDIEKVSDFYANPVLIKNERIFPIPNYGTGMTPFYTTLSLWVGALLLVSLLTTEVHEEKQYKSREVYFGRLLTFVSIAILQTLIVTSGNFLILGTYAASKSFFILFGVFSSIVFTVIVYTFVSVFGNVGKAISIIFLVLQISGAGGVYPVQVTPTFFQIINPFLPFTYAISMLREATGGIVWSTVLHDLFILIIFMLLAILLGLFLKGPINKKAHYMMELSKKSKIIH